MGYTNNFAKRLDLILTIPHHELSTTGYCLADPGQVYLVYFPISGDAKIDLRGTEGSFEFEWSIPLTNRTVIGPKPVTGGDYLEIEPPTILDAVLTLKKI